MKSFPMDMIQKEDSPGKLPVDAESSKARREVFMGTKRMLPEVPMAGKVLYQEALSELPEHAHLDSFEICYIRQGSLDWEVGLERYTLRKGDLFFTFPGEFHGGSHAMMQPCHLDFLQLNSKILSQQKSPVCRLIGEQLKELKRIPQRQLGSSPRIDFVFEGILEEFRREDGRSELQSRLLISFLLEEILRLNEIAGKKMERQGRYSFKIQKALNYLDAHWMDSPSIKTLAKVAELDPSRLQKRFKMEVGYNPHHYIISKKMDEAKKWLLHSKSDITTIAFSLGFTSSQYFSTVFKKYYGVNPRDFRDRSKKRLSNHGEV